MNSAKKHSFLLIFAFLILSKALALPVYFHDHDHHHDEEHCEDECELCEFALEMQTAAFSFSPQLQLPPTQNVVFIEKATSPLQFHFITQETNSFRITRPPPISF